MYNIDMNIIKGEIYKKGHNINEISQILNINEQTLSNWINGRNVKNIKRFIELLILLDIDPKDLIKKQID